MRKLVAVITLSTVAGLGAMLTTAGAAGAEPLSAASSSPDAAALIDDMHAGTRDVTAKLDAVGRRGSAVSVGDMFEMAMTMNHLSQLGDMSTSVVSTSNASVVAMARGVKA